MFESSPISLDKLLRYSSLSEALAYPHILQRREKILVHLTHNLGELKAMWNCALKNRRMEQEHPIIETIRDWPKLQKVSEQDDLFTAKRHPFFDVSTKAVVDGIDKFQNSLT